MNQQYANITIPSPRNPAEHTTPAAELLRARITAPRTTILAERLRRA